MIRSMLSQRVTVQKLARDPRGGGLEVSESTSEVPALIQSRHETSVDRNGQETVMRGLVYLAADAPLDVAHPDWRIEHNGKEFDVLAIAEIPDAMTGAVHHYEVRVR